jgi:ABC-2 type transport system permease protein
VSGVASSGAPGGGGEAPVARSAAAAGVDCEPPLRPGAPGGQDTGSPPARGRLKPLPQAAASVGFRTLLAKEVLRFWKVSFQTVAAPVLTGVLYLLVFGHVLEDRVEVFPGVGYTAFLIPGLVMMSLLQNAFANSSSSLIQSKITGNLVFVLLPPISNREFFAAYVAAAIVRGLVVGAGVFAVTVWFAPPPLKAPAWIAVFALSGAALLGVLGLIAGIVSEKFDQLAAFQNFVIMPATFLSGVFYSVHGLPPFWQAVSHLNPFFYMIDGFRYGFFAVADTSPWLSLAIVLAALAAASAVALAMLARGYKIRS